LGKLQDLGNEGAMASIGGGGDKENPTLPKNPKKVRVYPKK